MNRLNTKVNFLLFFSSFIFSIALGGCAPVNSHVAENNTTGTDGGIILPTPDPTHGKAKGEIVFVDSSSEDFRTALQAQPVPNVKLIYQVKQRADSNEAFSSATNSLVEVELPQEAKNVLSNYWQYLLSVRPDTDLAEMVFAKNDAESALQKITIDAPSGRRKIASDEAQELVEFIDKSFGEAADRIKSKK